MTEHPALTRRNFVATSAQLGAVAAPFVATRSHAANDKVLKIGLIGCGGRGSGAAVQAIRADKTNQLVAICDLFPDRLEKAYGHLKKAGGDQVQVPAAQRFSGFDGFQKLIDLDLDVVLLASPPGFRPKHLAACAKKGIRRRGPVFGKPSSGEQSALLLKTGAEMTGWRPGWRCML